MTGLATIIFSTRTWLLPALALTLAAAAALIWAGHRTSVENRVRLGCGLLKIAGILTLAVCLLEPLRVDERARPGANIFALLADNSQSLQIKDAGQTQSRGQTLREQLTGDTKGWQAALAENFQVRRYAFDTRLQDMRDFGELSFSGRASALGNALRTANGQWRGQPVAGVLLFTDGNATDDASELSDLENCPPVYPVVIGQDNGLRDLSLDKVTVSQTAFEDAPVTVQAEVGVHGFPGSTVVTRLIEVASSMGNFKTNATASANVSTNENRIIAEQQLTANG
ncbi:MAG TPA: hypothetical protein VFB72_17590, partial [Verrucomicrobiae bacterium]|nr:hypothetical protein [Verrucomicrobiae bacterium]